MPVDVVLLLEHDSRQSQLLGDSVVSEDVAKLWLLLSERRLQVLPGDGDERHIAVDP